MIIDHNTPDLLPIDSQWLIGKILVLNVKHLDEHYHSVEHQLFVATNGAGCDPTALGTTVFCVSMDGEPHNYNRQDFVAIVTPEQANKFLNK